MKNADIIGKWAFLIGLLLVVIAGLIPPDVYVIPQLMLILVVLGVIVGFLNINDKDTTKLLIAIIALIGVGSMTVLAIPTIGESYLSPILTNFIAFVGAATLVVAIKSIYSTIKK